MSLEHPNRRAYIAWIAVCVLWGTTYLGIRIALETIPPALVGGLRFTAAGILLVALLASRGEPVIRPRQWGGLALTGILTICVGNGGVIWAEQWVPSGIAAVTVATIPFWMIGIEAFARDVLYPNPNDLVIMIRDFIDRLSAPRHVTTYPLPP